MSEVIESSPHTVPTLMPGPYLLAFAIPLLLLSVTAGLAGAFLTLDRTRSFRPLDPPSTMKSSGRRGAAFRLEGGLGGLIGGWICGVHLTTYLMLLILNRSKLGLQDIQFLVIWILSGTVLAMVGGRWRIAASIFYSLIGGAGITSLLTIIFIPESLLPRFIIAGVLITVFLLLAFLPLPPPLHQWGLRVSASFSGSVSAIMAMALLTHAESWASPWLLFAVAPVIGHRNSQEKGLSAAVFLLAGTGIAVDWALKLRFGEDPDKAWDEYLAKYSKELPTTAHREGLFEPPKPLWQRIYGAFTGPKAPPYAYDPPSDIKFPPEEQLLPTAGLVMPKPFVELAGRTTPPPTFRPFAQKRQSLAGTRRKTTLSKRPPNAGFSDDSSDDSSSGDEATPKFRPWLTKRQTSMNSAASTIVASNTAGDALGVPKTLGKVAEYSDVDDVSHSSTKDCDTKDSRDEPGWKPAFLKDRTSMPSSSRTVTDMAGPPRLTSSPPSMPQHVYSSASHRKAPNAESLPIGAVPATQSLIRAYDRITRAQTEAYSRVSVSGDIAERPAGTRAVTGVTMPSAPYSNLDLDESFWTKVKTKAAEYRQPMSGVVAGEP